MAEGIYCLDPPPHNISDKCCQYAKKGVSQQIVKQQKYDLLITGIRKAEGGIRAQVYKSCFSSGKMCDDFRPIFWFTAKDRDEYERFYSVTHSRCYTEYGLKRTGCAGCPFGRKYKDELDVLQKYEPLLYKAVSNIFKDSYDYTSAYHQYCAEKEKAE